MTFDGEHLRQLKRLCKIECTPEEDQSIQERLEKVIGFMAQLNEADTENVPPCRSVLRSMLRNQTRDDEVQGILTREKFLQNASDQIGGMVRVPLVIKPQ